MEAYVNSVSDQLVVCSYPHCNFYFVYTANNQLKHVELQSDIEQEVEVLKNAVFARSVVVPLNHNLVLTPQNDASYESHFILNFEFFHELHQEHLEGISIVQDLMLPSVRLKNTLVKPELKSDMGLLIDKKVNGDALYFYPVSDKLTITAWKGGKLQLANRYPMANREELFYYVMLVVEQLDLDVSNLHVECLSTSGEHESIDQLFQNYLPRIQLTSVEVNYSFLPEESSQLRSELIMATFLSKCAL